MKPPHVYLIGLTGNIACGKSTVVAMLDALGAHTLDADQVTRRVQQPGTPVYQRIVEAFGPDIVTHPGGPLDRRKLGDLAFGNPAVLQRLEHIVHPSVHAELVGWLARVAGNVSAPSVPSAPPASPTVAVIDAIKLIEAGWKPHCDAVWVVTCPQEQQLERLIRTRGMSEAEARQRIAAQPSQASRVALADVVIDNSGPLAQTRAQVEAAWHRMAGRNR
ncbi:MAG: dephospho-CoA kinase [Chloroflexaceae bacterium]|nr:dephospho-CoA kinase [Chloroflexaceae bacterium]